MRAAQSGSKGSSSDATESQAEDAKPQRTGPGQGEWLPCNPEALPSEEETPPLLSAHAVDAWLADPAFVAEARTPAAERESPSLATLSVLAAGLLVFPSWCPAPGTETVSRRRENISPAPRWRRSAR